MVRYLRTANRKIEGSDRGYLIRSQGTEENCEHPLRFGNSQASIRTVDFLNANQLLYYPTILYTYKVWIDRREESPLRVIYLSVRPVT
jgi:hypothetical protein